MKPKRLNVHEMWELYKLLGEGFKNEYLWDEVIEMMKSLPPENIKQSMRLMYEDMPVFPIEIGLMFVKGLQYNGFFAFQKVVENLNGRSK